MDTLLVHVNGKHTRTQNPLKNTKECQKRINVVEHKIRFFCNIDFETSFGYQIIEIWTNCARSQCSHFCTHTNAHTNSYSIHCYCDTQRFVSHAFDVSDRNVVHSCTMYVCKIIESSFQLNAFVFCGFLFPFIPVTYKSHVIRVILLYYVSIIYNLTKKHKAKTYKDTNSKQTNCQVCDWNTNVCDIPCGFILLLFYIAKFALHIGAQQTTDGISFFATKHFVQLKQRRNKSAQETKL